jgi:hypothetical protein
MSASESICAPNGLLTPSRRASAPSRPSNATQATRQAAAGRTSPFMARKIAVRPSPRLARVQALTSAKQARRRAVCGPGNSAAPVSTAGATGPAGSGCATTGGSRRPRPISVPV